ncbi:MAG: asparagine synthase (glutamine-hydrolyzing) [Gammaproteobacteria bacterium]|nr:asparagine synthase (glutamine-hydrolyzing) [Gammaproteobacteria bacterium]
MCGINAIYRFDGQPVSERLLAKMNRALLHRGPDEQGLYSWKSIGLGHTRLSIVDVKHGHQPMHSEDGRYALTYNGELYNYQTLSKQLQGLGHNFHSHCDTEVLLKAHQHYGISAVDQLDGMYSYALFDRETEQLTLVRDRLGIKPLYYYQDENLFIAASEIKAIFASGLVEPELDIQTIYDHFYYQFSITPHTSFRNIKELPPGHRLIVSKDGSTSLQQYWDLEFPKDGEYESEDEDYWLAQFGKALDKSCQSHIIGDVEIGTYLSGGLDSSATSYFLQRHYHKELKSFSIHFENPNSDESYAYKPVAEHLGIQNRELTIPDPVPDDFIHMLEKSIYHLEQPQRLAVDIPHFMLSDFVHKQDVKVVYTGDGADELFGGYDCYRQDAIRQWGNEATSIEEKEKLYLNQFTDDFANAHMQMLLCLHEDEKQSQVTSRFGTYPAWYDFWQILQQDIPQIWANNTIDQHTRIRELAANLAPRVKNLHPLNQSLYYEIKTRLSNWILLKSDRLSMAHSVEARVPFLDHKLVELCARIPPQLKLKGMDEKYLLKKLMQPHLPQIPGEYKKRGFYTPIREWFFQTNANHGDYLNRDRLEASGIFNPESVITLLDEIQAVTQVNSIDEYYALMRKEWLLMLVLSTQILHHQFILKEAPIFHDIDI